jgi:tRNA A-37 threonylcarbamoyl transferase component Bud32
MRICPQCRKTFEDSVEYCPNDGTKMTGLDAGHPGSDLRGEGAVLGAYRVLKLIGSGGMGQVYLAQHTRLGRKVALKLLHKDRANDPQAVKRFFAEARAVNQINQENIVQITDFIEDDGADKYYIMEYLEGATLSAVHKAEKGISLARAMRIAMQVCRALGAVHSAGIIHRDLKPDNIFLTPRPSTNDFVKLLDFGVAKLVDASSGESVGNTAAFAVLGTPEYMSPEQLGGSGVDYRTDIYALGVILYELCTGKKPFVGSTFGDYVIKHSTIAPTPPSHVPGLPQPIPTKLEALILRCLAKDPEDRPQSMHAIENELRDVLSGMPHEGGMTMTSPFMLVVGQLVAHIERVPTGGKVVALARRTWRRIWEVPALTRLHPKTRPLLACVAGLVLLAVLGSPFYFGGAPAVTAVRITFQSTPPGATVFRTGDDQPLGVTPVALELQRSVSLADFELRKAGHTPARAKVSLATDTQVNVVLAAAAILPPKQRAKQKRSDGDKDRPRGGKKTRGSDKGGIIDPFGD